MALTEIKRRENFKKYANKRLHNALVCLKRVRSLANRHYYHFTEKEKTTLLKHINDEVNSLKHEFNNGKIKTKNKDNQPPKYFDDE